MQTLSHPEDSPATPATPRASAWAPRRAEFRFTTEAALERALELALAQPWIGACTVDRARRTLRVSLAAGTSAPARCREASPALH